MNKPAAAGGKAMMDIRNASGDAHKLLTTSSSIYMAPLSSRLPMSWRDFTPIALLAQDEFLLWTYTDASFKTAQEFLVASKMASPPMRIGAAGSRREDHLITSALEQEAGGKITYIPYAGSPTSVELAGKHIEASTGNPSEEISSWRAGNARPLCVLSAQRMSYTAKIVNDTAWSDIPTCGEQGIKLAFNMLHGMFMPGKVTPTQQAYYVNLFKRAIETPEWKAYVERNALLPDFREGQTFVQFPKEDEQRHKELMAKAGFIA